MASKKALYQKEWRDKNPGKNAKYQMKYRTKIPFMSIYRTARQRAKAKGLDFNLEFTDLIFPTHCPILGMPIKSYSGDITKRSGGRLDSVSLDQIDPTKGYVKGNVQVISHLANMMKSGASPEQLKRFANWINTNYV